jgi:CheY-like chemotaxis protein
LQQILKNLLSNSFKFTEKGKVVLSVETVEPSAVPASVTTSGKPGDLVLKFAVKDTGIGIPKDKQKLIFEAFQQADGTTNRKYGGTGLGLTISREIARLLGGVIEVESSPGAGSTFTLFLPQNYPGAEGAPRDVDPDFVSLLPPLPEDADFKNRRILIVDDDMRNIYAITSVLESYGMKVNYAENGRQAIDYLKRNPETDMILMDTMMPEMDGLEATSAIRELPEFSELPIISLTAKAMKGDREKCIAAGASDYITKPVDPDKLLSLMHIWLTKTEALVPV